MFRTVVVSLAPARNSTAQLKRNRPSFSAVQSLLGCTDLSVHQQHEGRA
jgi:hypothetical protein